MKRITKVIILAVIFVFVVTLISFGDSVFAKSGNNLDYNHSWTKAICNETHCQDYVIYCKDNEFVRQRPITGAVITIPQNWEDPRDEAIRVRICN